MPLKWNTRIYGKLLGWGGQLNDRGIKLTTPFVLFREEPAVCVWLLNLLNNLSVLQTYFRLSCIWLFPRCVIFSKNEESQCSKYRPGLSRMLYLRIGSNFRCLIS